MSWKSEMTFYIKPPEGNVTLKKLHQDAEVRLHFLHQIHHRLDEDDQMDKIWASCPNIAIHSECLIDGSLRDRISHFILRLASLKNRSFQTFLTDTETCLFRFRMLSGGQSTLKQSLVNLKRHVRYALKQQNLRLHHRELLQQVHEMVAHILTTTGMLECQNRNLCHHSVVVPWTMVDALVRDRSVSVTGGKVDMHCHLLMLLLCTVFRDVITRGIEELSSLTLNHDPGFSDPRINTIKKSLRSTFSKLGGGSVRLNIPLNLTHNDIEKESRLFPLCMQQLHRILSKTNRLRHHSRLRYTLFLKDVGLPVNENIMFWERFYSKPYAGTTTSCNHSWTGSCGNRYTYSIRHVYGLEGGRINYTSHSCKALQATSPQPSEMSGCPLTGPDHEEIFSILKTFYGDKPFLKEVMAQVVKRKPNIACKLLLRYSLHFADISPTKVDSVHLRKEGDLLQGNETTNRLDGEHINKVLTVKNKSPQTGDEHNEESKSPVEKKCLHECRRIEKQKPSVQKNSSHVKSEDRGQHCFSHLEGHDCDRVSNNGNNAGNFTFSRTKASSISSVSHCENCIPDDECRSELRPEMYNPIQSNTCCTSKRNAHPKLSCTSCHCQPVNADMKSQSCAPLYDIEDASFISQCNFNRPSQYYLLAKSNPK